MSSLSFRIANTLLNRGYIIEDIAASRLQATIEKLLPAQATPGPNELFVVCFGRGNQDWTLAEAKEVGQYLSKTCTNFVYPLSSICQKDAR